MEKVGAELVLRGEVRLWVSFGESIYKVLFLFKRNTPLGLFGCLKGGMDVWGEEGLLF